MGGAGRGAAGRMSEEHSAADPAEERGLCSEDSNAIMHLGKMFDDCT